MAVPLVSNGRFDACRKIVDGVKVTAASFLEQSIFYGCNIVVSLFGGGDFGGWLRSMSGGFFVRRLRLRRNSAKKLINQTVTTAQ